VNDREGSGRRYLIISPCRDEARHCRHTLDAVTQQTLLPDKWIIADGSRDGTMEILNEYASAYDFIDVQHEDEAHDRWLGVGVINAFNRALATVDLDDYDYICKLDLDLDLPPNYFESLIERMEEDNLLGSCSGKPYFRHPLTGALVSEKCGDETSVGMSKFYRASCFREIGGFVNQVMWDGIDCHRARMLGWRVASWDDPSIRIRHLRMMASSHKGILTGRFREGFGKYFMGTSLPYMFAASMYRTTRPPIVTGGLAMMAGYVWSMLTRKQRYQDEEFRQFLRSYQWQCLLLGKKEATRRLEEKMIRERYGEAEAPRRSVSSQRT
jgi:biofilm PGA synthesis N-glycosyltransferase PgaC